ncbi:AzlD domain-containing protein [Streptomyces violaceus]|uniref:AzlD domain-containing protein n=1 Tax=Streptomyces TaxID=1883 RepID=UPI0020C11742|nr:MULTISPECIES: AzlD domain-containing protein [Streptomyces]MCK8432062.1 AzlD domain-containing protein [Streptomyces sp. D2-8]MCT9140387.1 AzlD domain-containing protein [Streptomyces violarus]
MLPALAAMFTLAAGTFLLRLSGPLLRAKVSFPQRAEKLLEVSAVLLLAALAATSALTEGHAFAGPARPIGVLVGGVLAWRRAPFLVVVLAAAGTAALLRLAGVP